MGERRIEKGTSMYRIFIVDDHPIMRRGYTALLTRESDLQVCGEAGSGEEAIEQIQKMNPDLVIVDISMDGMNGIEMIKYLKTLRSELPFLVVSMHDETLYAERAIHAGASGYIMKSEVGVSVITAVRRILLGGIYLSEQMSSKLLRPYFGRPKDATGGTVRVLSDRELEIFELMGRGITTSHIAEMLHISPKTVESHRARIKSKLGLENTAQLRQRAVLWVNSDQPFSTN